MDGLSERGSQRGRNRLIPWDFDPEDRIKVHIRARTEQPKGYPQRVPVSSGTTWETLDKNYSPVDYTAQVVLEHDRTQDPSNPRLWADPFDPQTVEHPYFSYEGEICFDNRGRPLNPKGPTGLEGRGLLGRWGPNFAADPIVTRINEGKFQVILIKREDNGRSALPGGMVDRREKVSDTLKRELEEETSTVLDFENADLVYKGYVDDPRNTDNSWMETDAYHLHLPPGEDIKLAAGDDAVSAAWETVDSNLLENLHGSHSIFIQKAICKWQGRTGKIVDNTGFVKSI